MEAEISGEVGAELGEVSPEARVTHRNGYRPRPWETRVGEIKLLIARNRQVCYFPSFPEPRRRLEQALVAVVLEAYVNGISTRKVDRLVEQLGIEGMTKDRVSVLCRNLDEQLSCSVLACSTARIPTCGWTPSRSRSAITAGGLQGAGDRPRGPRDHRQRGSRARRRRGRVRRVLDRVPARPQEAWALRRPAGGVR
jgi:Transposase, Mutator family